jgi:branched-chain amino acid transport system ATP-binding protein
VLEVSNLQVVYDNAVEAVRDVSLTVSKGGIVALLGSNGAGKSTILKALSGVLYEEQGEIRNGTLTYDGADCASLRPHELVARGIVHVPEGRRLFDQLTVEENLLVGAHIRPANRVRALLEEVYILFPEIRDHRKRVSGYLSGGQQQMVAVGRALMAEPRMLLLDEPSLGLAPIIIAQIFERIAHLRREYGLSVLLVEQNARLALSIADYGYIVESGRVVLDGPPAKLLANEDVKEFYLGVRSEGDRKSMRDVKHYKRRKRWLS